MAFVYIIQDKVSKKYYIGSCVDLYKRMQRHKNNTGSITTKKGIWDLICYSETKTIAEARILEKKVKSYKSGNGLKKIINGEVAEWPKAPHC
ncbi:MAG: GIY-YIG nuclease family protein [Candidatus Paceibacterota bacterium]